MTTSIETEFEYKAKPYRPESSTAVETLELSGGMPPCFRFEEVGNTERKYQDLPPVGNPFLCYVHGNSNFLFMTPPTTDAVVEGHIVDADFPLIEGGSGKMIQGNASYGDIWHYLVSSLAVSHRQYLESGPTIGNVGYPHPPIWFTLAKEFGGETEGTAEHRKQERHEDLFFPIRGHNQEPGSDTGHQGHVLVHREIRAVLERALLDGANEVFESGMESAYSRTLDRLIRRYSNDAVAELRRILRQESGESEVREETLVQLGSMEHNPTHQDRLSLLIMCLGSDHISIRDSASLGIAAMDDPSAIPSLRYAINNEKSDRLRRDFELVLEQLVDTMDTNRWLTT